YGLPGKSEVRDGLERAADPKAGRERTGAGEEPSGKPACERRDQPDSLDDRGVFIAREAEVDDKGRSHDARKRVRELAEHDEGERYEHHDQRVACEEVDEGADR